MLEVNQIAPDFSLPDQHGQTRTLAEYQGQWLLIYFYPQDDTPGCTIEACMITEVYDDFAKLGVAVVGVSKDSVESHLKFAEKYRLPFTLVSDIDCTMIVDYQANGDMGDDEKPRIKRISYLINPEGIITKTYPDVDPSTHAMSILKDVREIMGNE